MPYALHTSLPANFEATNRTEMLSRLKDSAWDFYSTSRDSAELESIPVRVQYNTALLCVLIKAVILFQRLAARLRKREEEELRAFKIVHIRASLLQAPTAESKQPIKPCYILLSRVSPKALN
jgi:hypothetical protein